MKIVKRFAILIVLNFLCTSLLAQPCDALQGKDFKELYQLADFVCIGRITKIEDGLNGGQYCNVKPTCTLKGSPLFIGFNQLGNNKFVYFHKDSSYVFFVFRKYQDDYFMPCLYFGLPQKMKLFMEWRSEMVSSQYKKEHPNEKCNFAHKPTCGCDGILYENACLARQAGIEVLNEGCK